MYTLKSRGKEQESLTINQSKIKKSQSCKQQMNYNIEMRTVIKGLCTRKNSEQENYKEIMETS